MRTSPTQASVFLVAHREGHCVAKDGFFPDGQDLVPTLCGSQVVMPFGISADLHLLDCEGCREQLSAGGDQTQLTE